MDRFELISRYKDVSSSNVNEIFESYGCSTLEAKVPIVDSKVAESVQHANFEQQQYETLTFKKEAGLNAVEGRIPRTRDRPLTLVEIGRETVIAAGKQRDKSPVDREELDEELAEYMKKTEELRAKKLKARQEREALARAGDAALPNVKAQITRDIDPDWD